VLCLVDAGVSLSFRLWVDFGLAQSPFANHLV